MLSETIKTLVVTLALVPILATAIPLLRKTDWWIRLFDFPRLQVTVLGAAALAIYPWVFDYSAVDYAVLTATFAATLWQLHWILPYTPLTRKQVMAARKVIPQERLRLLVANVLTPNRRAPDLLHLIKEADPDVVLTLESDAWWEQQLATLESRYPYCLKCPLDNLYGMHLYSRLELIDPQIRYLVEKGIPSMHAELVLRSGHRLELHCLHPAPPSPTQNETSAERDAELLIVGKAVGQGDHSVIVTGDLNDVAWSRTTQLFRKISGLLDPRIGRGLFSTFHAEYPFLRWPLDHLFHSDDFTLVSIRTLPYFGSDHFPILIELQHEPRAEPQQQTPSADSEDRRRMREKINAVAHTPL
ncbi:MAG: endonuclease/exonuclease/phosphatase family protein [Nitrococcus mobilis]|nr:endonuclease/exonuclease/phosphatase family protein [Nitrococcus mobilis]